MLIISLSAPMQKRKRRFKGHAQSWFYQLKPSKPGEMVQVDHMTVNTSQCSVKHFQRWDPLSKYIFADVCSNATSRSAKAFLKNLIKSVPFKITSIQVDGSSEFMKEFEQACYDKTKSNFNVLPPKRPQYNGRVECGNRIFREEFYARKDMFADSVGAIKSSLKDALQKYNNYRRHFNLDGLTPLQYINNTHEVI